MATDPTANLLGNPLEGTPWMPAGDPFQNQFASAPITIQNRNQSFGRPAGTAGSGPSAVGVNPLAPFGIGGVAPQGQQGTNLTDYSQVWQGAQQAPWWTAFSQTPGVPKELLNPKYSTQPSNFADMWGFQNPSLLPLLLLLSSRPLSPAQMRVPPIRVPPPLAPVIQPGNPAPPALGGGGGGGGGEGGGGGNRSAPPPSGQYLVATGSGGFELRGPDPRGFPPQQFIPGFGAETRDAQTGQIIYSRGEGAGQ